MEVLLGGVFDILIIDGIEWCLLCSVGNMKVLNGVYSVLLGI
jgi:hypothetical protein